jgi:hypothetical protein
MKPERHVKRRWGLGRQSKAGSRAHQQTHRLVLKDKAVRKAKNDDEVGPSRGPNDAETLIRF